MKVRQRIGRATVELELKQVGRLSAYRVYSETVDAGDMGGYLGKVAKVRGKWRARTSESLPQEIEGGPWTTRAGAISALYLRWSA